MPKKTRDAAAELGVPFHQLNNWMSAGKLVRPQKDSSGDYVWSEEDLDRVRQIIATRKRSVSA